MQFAHFDGSLTPVPSIHDALVAIESRDWRNQDDTTGRVVTRRSVKAEDVDSNGRVVFTEVTAVEGISREAQYDDAYLPDVTDDGNFTEADAKDAVAWNETPYGFYREDVTRKYQARILNVFRKDGNLRVGSITIAHTDNSVTATCVRCKVSCTLDFDANFYGLGYDLDLMQAFTSWTIRHGSQHKARQIDDRIVQRTIAVSDDRSEVLTRWLASA